MPQRRDTPRAALSPCKPCSRCPTAAGAGQTRESGKRGRGGKKRGGWAGAACPCQAGGFLSPALGTTDCAPFSARDGADSSLRPPVSALYKSSPCNRHPRHHVLPSAPKQLSPFHGPQIAPGTQEEGYSHLLNASLCLPQPRAHFYSLWQSLSMLSCPDPPLFPHPAPFPFCPAIQEDFRNTSCTETFSPSVPRWSETASARDLAFFLMSFSCLNKFPVNHSTPYSSSEVTSSTTTTPAPTCGPCTPRCRDGHGHLQVPWGLWGHPRDSPTAGNAGPYLVLQPANQLGQPVDLPLQPLCLGVGGTCGEAGGSDGARGAHGYPLRAPLPSGEEHHLQLSITSVLLPGPQLPSPTTLGHPRLPARLGSGHRLPVWKLFPNSLGTIRLVGE